MCVILCCDPAARVTVSVTAFSINVLFSPPTPHTCDHSEVMQQHFCLLSAEHHSARRIDVASPLQHSITVQPSNQPKKTAQSLVCRAAPMARRQRQGRRGSALVVPRRERVIRETNLAPLKACVTRYRTIVSLRP
jgi:hypothetical protein